MHKFLLYLCTAILFTSCGKAGVKEEEARIFRMNLPAGLASLDPAFASDQATTWMCTQLYNGLVTLDTLAQVQPALAHRWEISDSGRTYTFHLREGVEFHPDPAFRGPRRLVARDFVYSFTRICDPAVAARGFWIFNGRVVGVDEFREGKAPAISGFSAPDDTTFTIRLREPFPPFLGLLAMAYASAVPREVVEAHGTDFRAHPVGTGPFLFKSWAAGRSLILLRNPRYWEKDANGQPLPYLEAVHARFIQERLSEFVELCQGRLDFVSGMDKTTRDEVFLPQGGIRPQYLEQFNFHIAPTLNTEFIGFFTDSAAPLLKDHPLRDRRVRQALNHAIDREKLVDYVLNGQGYPAHAGIVPPGLPGFDSVAVQGYRYDPDRAAQLLAEAGYPGGKGLPLLVLKSNPSYQGVMEYVQKSLERIGVSLEIDNVDGPTLREMATKGELLLWRASWIADYPDPENYLALLHSGHIPPNGPNRMRYSSPAYDRLYTSALRTVDDSTRISLYHEMERIALQDAPVILLYYDKMLRIVRKGITGLETNALNILYLKRVRKTLE